MGFLSDIWKGVKNVFKGILKIFQPILEPLGKLLNSDFGKALMIGLSIFTLGSAMVAGYGAFSAAMATPGTSFMSAFVEGGKVFLQTLTGIGGKEAGTTGVAEGAEAAQAASEAGQLSVVGGGTPELAGQGGIQAGAEAGGALAEGASGSMAFGPGATGDAPMRAVTSGAEGMAGGGAMLPPEAAATGAGQAATGVAPPITGTEAASGAIQAAGQEGNWLTRAAKGAMDFAKSEGGGQVVGSLIQGVGNYYTEKDRQEFEDRIRRQWMKGTGDRGVRDIRDASARIGNLPTPSAQDIARTSRDTANEDQRRPTFTRAYGAGAA